MSDLQTYLQTSGTRQADLAEQIGVTQGTISRLKSGQIKPGLDLALRIEAATRGAVPVSAWGDQVHNAEGAAQ